MESIFGPFVGRIEWYARLVAQGLKERWEKTGRPCDPDGNPIVLTKSGKVGAVFINGSWRITGYNWGRNRIENDEWKEVFVPIVYLISKHDGRDVWAPYIGRDITKVLKYAWNYRRDLERAGKIKPYISHLAATQTKAQATA